MSHAFVFDKPSFPSMPLFTAGLKSDFSLKLRGGGLFPSIFNSKISQKLKASMDGFSSVGKKTTGKGSKLAGKWTKVKEVGQEDAMLQVFLHRVRMFRIWLAGVVSARASFLEGVSRIEGWPDFFSVVPKRCPGCCIS
jgi:hypothetical protein